MKKPKSIVSDLADELSQTLTNMGFKAQPSLSGGVVFTIQKSHLLTVETLINLRPSPESESPNKSKVRVSKIDIETGDKILEKDFSFPEEAPSKDILQDLVANVLEFIESLQREDSLS